MRITQETEYAIQIVDYLARSGRRAGALEISKEIISPLRFTKNTLQKLARTGIIKSYLGNHGGYELGRSPEEISLYDVMEVTEGPIRLHRCLSVEYECAYKPDKQQCPYHEAFWELSCDMESEMREFRFSCAVNERQFGDFTGAPDKQPPDHFVSFSTQERGYDQDEVAAYIARLHHEYEEMTVNYEALQKENTALRMRLGERC